MPELRLGRVGVNLNAMPPVSDVWHSQAIRGRAISAFWFPFLARFIAVSGIAR